ncbi:hypothetical protein QQY66_17155 [Streptomyces sp. DG2A-72]|nr:hypothetical protein [Streptomyces sp. DG2A-72]MDO0933332.1 hypothetical protein [Streptomyces sp. DG2A-72]
MVARPSARRANQLLRLGLPDERPPQLRVQPTPRKKFLVRAVLSNPAAG